MTDSTHIRMNARARRRGLTLVELLLVIVVMGVITTVAAPKLRGTGTKTSPHGASTRPPRIVPQETRRVLRLRKSMRMNWPSVIVVVK